MRASVSIIRLMCTQFSYIRGARFAGTVAFALTCAVIPSCKQKAAPIVAKKLVLPDSAQQMVYGFNMVLTDNGVSKGRLLADTAYTYQESTGMRYELRRLNLKFFTPTGVDDGTMTGKEGTYNERLNRIEGRGNVIVIRKDGNRLDSPQLVYDNARNQIFSDSSFILIQPGKQTLTGIGFESDPKLNNLKCHQNCKYAGSTKVSN